MGAQGQLHIALSGSDQVGGTGPEEAYERSLGFLQALSPMMCCGAYTLRFCLP